MVAFIFSENARAIQNCSEHQTFHMFVFHACSSRQTPNNFCRASPCQKKLRPPDVYHVCRHGPNQNHILQYSMSEVWLQFFPMIIDSGWIHVFGFHLYLVQLTTDSINFISDVLDITQLTCRNYGPLHNIISHEHTRLQNLNLAMANGVRKPTPWQKLACWRFCQEHKHQSIGITRFSN